MLRRVEFGRLWAAFAVLLAIAFAVVFTAAPGEPLFEQYQEPTVDVPAEEETPVASRQYSFDAERTAYPRPAPKAKKDAVALPSLLPPLVVVTQLTTFSGQQSAPPDSKSRRIPNARGPPIVES